MHLRHKSPSRCCHFIEDFTRTPWGVDRASAACWFHLHPLGMEHANKPTPRPPVQQDPHSRICLRTGRKRALRILPRFRLNTLALVAELSKPDKASLLYFVTFMPLPASIIGQGEYRKRCDVAATVARKGSTCCVARKAAIWSFHYRHPGNVVVVAIRQIHFVPSITSNRA